MKTITPKQVPADERKWFIIDAEGQVLGRLATKIATIISGKNRVDWAPHLDNGDYLIVINAGKVVVTGNKEADKMYRTHSGFMGGLKETNLAKLRVKRPIGILEHAVNGMLPKNRLRDAMFLRLKLSEGAEHSYEAQKPTVISL